MQNLETKIEPEMKIVCKKSVQQTKPIETNT
jgi:hypothetical protein